MIRIAAPRLEPCSDGINFGSTQKSLCSASFGFGHDAELLHQSEGVPTVPALSNFSIGDACNADSGYGKAAPGARYAGQFAFVGADDCPASDFSLAVRERVVDGEVGVRKGVHIGINELLVAVDSAGHGGGT